MPFDSSILPSLIARYDPRAESLSDGAALTTLTDRSGAGRDLTGTGCTFRAGSGNPYYGITGTGVFTRTGSLGITGDWSAVMVVQPNSSNDGYIGGLGSSNNPLFGRVNSRFSLGGSYFAANLHL